MNMFCYQCQETDTSSDAGCSVKGICGKTADMANLQDVLLYVAKGIALCVEQAGELDKETTRFVMKSLFSTVTNVSFDDDKIIALIEQGLTIRDELKQRFNLDGLSHDAANWSADDFEGYIAKAQQIGVVATENEDIRSLKETLIYGVKGIAAYADHAAVLGYEDDELNRRIIALLAVTTKELELEEWIGQVLHVGEVAVTGMALLDKANTETYGHPEISEVKLGVSNNPGILVSGHDLKDLEQLLQQTQGAGVDVYTHGEMLPAHYYPAFKKYPHLVGNYGNAWWQQKEEFEAFNGPVLMTTNCLVPPKGKSEYKNKVFTTGNVNFPGLLHVEESEAGEAKDFSAIIACAKTCQSPSEIETGTIVGGFAHNQVLALADKVVAAVKSGAIKRFVVMGGCDGRDKSREYFTDVAKNLPEDAVILTAGCAKYRYNKLDLGDIGGIPRVLDAGQCNDCYSLAVIALKLKEVFELEDINDLPISFDIGWYEQKAVAVLLALLHLGVKGIRLGPTLPVFLSENVANYLVENFDIKGIDNAKDDIRQMMVGN